MKTIITFGVYDMLHIGHVLLFKRIKDLYKNEEVKLVVAVQDSVSILKYKPDTRIVYNTDERVFMVESIKYVDDVVTYNDVDIDIKKFNFDVFVIGPDQKHKGFQKAIQWCMVNNKDVRVLPRTEGVSSTMLKKSHLD